VQDVVRRKHEHLNHNFYTCSVEMLAGLSEMWVSDAPISTICLSRAPEWAFFLVFRTGREKYSRKNAVSSDGLRPCSF
jgi:hypothetical protein